jgi:FADH2 O2-dependent halogenase
MRADVDAYLVEQARAVGVDYRDRLEIVAAESVSDGMRLRGRHGGSEIQIETGFVVDASGAGEVMARALGIESTGDEIEFSSRLVYSHFEGVQPFADAALGAGACLPVGPYADNLAAVHHLIDEGWIYALNFDDGLTSVGMLIDLAYAPGGSQLPDAANPDELWRAVVDRYPTLRTAFTGAKSLPPGLRSTARLQRRRRQAVGARWAMLPQTFAFFDPLFSTGIAWSLLGVERLAELLAEPVVSTSALDRYQALLMAEADQQQALLEAAYTARRDFTVFRDLSFLYFACVSFEEIRQRLLDRPNDPGVAWRGLLGAGDPHWTSLFRDAGDRVAETLTDGSEGARRRFSAWVTSGIRSRNLVGLGMSKTHLYGLDTAHLVESSALLGLTAAEMKSALPRLRGSIRSDEIG